MTANTLRTLLITSALHAVAAGASETVDELMRAELRAAAERFLAERHVSDEDAMTSVLAESGSPGLSVLSELLETGDSRAGAVAIRALAAHQGPAAEAIRRRVALDHPDPWTRRKAIEELAVPAETAGIRQALVDRLRNADPAARRGALEGLRLLGDPAALPAIATFLSSDDRRIRQEALGAVAEWADPAATDAILDLLGSPDVQRQAAGVEAAACYIGARMRRSESSLPGIERFLAASRPELRSEILRGVAMVRDHLPGLAGWPLVLASAEASDPAIRRLAAYLLRVHEGAGAHATLLDLLVDPNLPVRLEAARSLAGRGDPRGVPLLLEARETGGAVLDFDGGRGPDPDPIGSTMRELTGHTAEDWRAWWETHGSDLDVLGRHLELFEPSRDAERYPSTRVIGTLGTPATAEALLDLFSRPTTRFETPLLEALAILVRRFPEAEDGLAAAVLDRRYPNAQRQRLLYALHQADRRRFAQVVGLLLAGPDAEDLEVLAVAHRYADRELLAAALAALLPRGTSRAGNEWDRVYDRLGELGGPEQCTAVLESASHESFGSGAWLSALAAVGSLRCPGGEILLLDAIGRWEPRPPYRPGIDLGVLVHALSRYREPALIPGLLSALAPHTLGAETSGVVLAVAAMLGTRTIHGVVRQLASSEHGRRAGALFVLEAVLREEYPTPFATRDGDYYLMRPELERSFVRAALGELLEHPEEETAAGALRLLTLLGG